MIAAPKYEKFKQAVIAKGYTISCWMRNDLEARVSIGINLPQENTRWGNVGSPSRFQDSRAIPRILKPDWDYVENAWWNVYGEDISQFAASQGLARLHPALGLEIALTTPMDYIILPDPDDVYRLTTTRPPSHSCCEQCEHSIFFYPFEHCAHDAYGVDCVCDCCGREFDKDSELIILRRTILRSSSAMFLDREGAQHGRK